MHYLLDTNACIALLNGRPSSLVNRVRRLTSSEFGLPAPVTYELYYGAFKSRDTDRNLKLLDRIAFEVVPFDAADARALKPSVLVDLHVAVQAVLMAGPVRCASRRMSVSRHTSPLEPASGLDAPACAVMASPGHPRRGRGRLP